MNGIYHFGTAGLRHSFIQTRYIAESSDDSLRSQPSPVLIPYISHLSSPPWPNNHYMPINGTPPSQPKTAPTKQPTSCCVSQWEIRGTPSSRPVEGYKYDGGRSVVTSCTRHLVEPNQTRPSEHMLHERRKPRLDLPRLRRIME